uniref:Uncharacterized protein n=1 Tax=Setaria italica TaxID=4555 RepID=K4ANP1_SETIT
MRRHVRGQAKSHVSSRRRASACRGLLGWTLRLPSARAEAGGVGIFSLEFTTRL